VPGVPITRYCDEHALDTEARLRLFIRVCEGVQHAHLKAVIHRDIKPSNVLVAMQDDRPVPKIIDFGVAKTLTRSLADTAAATVAGTIVGTPEYMSPEQIDLSGDVDTRTDVYSLGVLLYELLVGEVPFPARDASLGFEEFRRRVREVDPETPSTRVSGLRDGLAEAARLRHTSPAVLVRKLRGELDWITTKALEKDRNLRYGSPAELAADVRRYLDLEPLVAGPPGRTYRIRKFVRRNRAAVTAGGFVALALVIGVGGLAFGLVRAKHAEAEARQETAKSAAVNRFLQEMLASVRPEEARGREVTVREVLDEASRNVTGGPLADQEEVEAAVRTTIGSTYEALGQLDAAESHLRIALDLRRQLHQGPDREVAESLHNLGKLSWERSDYPEAERLIRSALDMYRQVVDPEDPAVVSCLNDLAVVLQSEGHYEQAEPMLREALAMLRARPEDEDQLLPDTMNNLAWALHFKGEYAEAEQLLRDALALNRRLLGEGHPSVLAHAINVAATLHLHGKYAEAESLYVETLATCRRVLGDDHSMTLRGMRSLGELYLETDRPDLAEPVLKDALEKAEQTLGSDHTLTIILLADMGWLHRARGELAAAEPFYREVLARRRATLGDEHPDTIRAGWQVARVLVDQGRFAEAEPFARDALERGRRVLPAGNENVSSACLFLGLALLGQDHAAEAEPLLRECFDERSATLPAGRWEVDDARSALGAALARQGRFAESEPLLVDGYEGLRSSPAAPPIRVRAALERLVALYDAWGAAEPSPERERAAAQRRAELRGL